MIRKSNFEFEDDEKPSIRVKVKTLLGKEAKYLIADVLSSEVVQNSFIDKKIMDMLLNM